MTFKDLEKGLKKYSPEKINSYLEDDVFPQATIRVIVIDENYEYGYNDFTFEYSSGEKLHSNIKGDLEDYCLQNKYTLNDIIKLEAYIHFYDDEDDDYEDFYDYDIVLS